MTGSASPSDEVRFARFRPEARATRRRLVATVATGSTGSTGAGLAPKPGFLARTFSQTWVLAWRLPDGEG